MPKSRNIKITLEYDGTNFKGWQVQRKNVRTIQHEIEQALQKIYRRHISVVGSGRTDSGVHAVGQVANFHVATSITLQGIRNALNAYLPDDIVIHKTEEAPPKFNAQFSAKRKTYRYTILNRKIRAALDRNRVFQFSRTLNLALMRRQARYVLGKKDFISFMSSDPTLRERSTPKNTVRTIYECRIKKSGDMITIDITADGFLYRMVRNIVGTLLDIGSGRMKTTTMKNIIEAKDRKRAGAAVPAHGLCLMKVEY